VRVWEFLAHATTCVRGGGGEGMQLGASATKAICGCIIFNLRIVFLTLESNLCWVPLKKHILGKVWSSKLALRYKQKSDATSVETHIILSENNLYKPRIERHSVEALLSTRLLSKT
jgi:hypothetical protein